MEEEKLRVEWGSEKLCKAQEAVDADPYDLESWNVLIRESAVKHIVEVRPFYEQLVSVFPTCARYWRVYIEQEMKSRNFEKVEKVCRESLYAMNLRVCIREAVTDESGQRQ